MKLPCVIQVGPKRISEAITLTDCCRDTRVGTQPVGRHFGPTQTKRGSFGAMHLAAAHSDPNRRAPQGRTTHTDPRKSKKKPTFSFRKMSDNYVQIEIGRLYLDKTYELKNTRALLGTRKKRNGAAAGASVQANYDPKKCQIREEETPTSCTIY